MDNMQKGKGRKGGTVEKDSLYSLHLGKQYPPMKGFEKKNLHCSAFTITLEARVVSAGTTSGLVQIQDVTELGHPIPGMLLAACWVGKSTNHSYSYSNEFSCTSAASYMQTGLIIEFIRSTLKSNRHSKILNWEGMHASF